MAHFRGHRSAFGSPGCEPRWTDADKDGVGTAFSQRRRVWFTIRRGILTEVYYPTVDRPQLRDLEFLFSDGNGLFLEEKRDLEYADRAPAAVSGISDQELMTESGRFSLTKEIIVEPTRPVFCCMRTEGRYSSFRNLKTYLLCAPHLEGEGQHNNAFVIEVSGRESAGRGKAQSLARHRSVLRLSAALLRLCRTERRLYRSGAAPQNGVRVRRGQRRKCRPDRRTRISREQASSRSASRSAKRFPMLFRRFSRALGLPLQGAPPGFHPAMESAANGRKPLARSQR